MLFEAMFGIEDGAAIDEWYSQKRLVLNMVQLLMNVIRSDVLGSYCGIRFS